MSQKNKADGYGELQGGFMFQVTLGYASRYDQKEGERERGEGRREKGEGRGEKGEGRGRGGHEKEKMRLRGSERDLAKEIREIEQLMEARRRRRRRRGRRGRREGREPMETGVLEIEKG